MIFKKYIRFFNKARLASEQSDYPRVHIGCIAVYHGRVIGTGCNGSKAHPIQKKYNIHRISNSNVEFDSLPAKIHAEIACIKSINVSDDDIDWTKVSLYIYRKCISREHGIARPCPACMHAIKEKGIRDIYYTTNDGFAYEKLDNK